MENLSILAWAVMVVAIVTPLLTVLGFTIRAMVRTPLSDITIKVDVLTGRMEDHIEDHKKGDAQIDRIDKRVDDILLRQVTIAGKVDTIQKGSNGGN